MRDPALSPPPAVELQDHLLTASHDLERLGGLLEHACDDLLQGFHGAAADLQALVDAAGDPPAQQHVDRAMQHLGGAITALQFQDMAAQLIAHTHQRLRHCADRVARDLLGADGDEAVIEPAPMRPNPVTQDEMDTGPIELFHTP